jgi:VIT1/CCC1 family predicted Fe2+/Mn2+ transporter
VGCLFFLGFFFGTIAGCWEWAVRHFKSFFIASFVSGFTMLLPFFLNTYGYALVAFPLVLVWVATNFMGMTVTKRLQTKDKH